MHRKLLISIMIATLIIIFTQSCEKNKESLDINNNIASRNLVEPDLIPFFNLAKGDSISHDIYREKPIILEGEESTILYSTESTLKTSGNSTGSDPITGLHVSIRNDNTVGDFLWNGLTKIPIDLNEGAGGKYIYLFYTKSTIDSPPTIKDIRVLYQNCCSGAIAGWIAAHPQYGILLSDGYWADINDGAGGNIINIAVTTSGINADGNPVTAIKNILIASGDSPDINFPGWIKINVDLNRGAGGKYIYLFYQR